VIGQVARAALLVALDECDSESAEVMLQREALDVDLARVAKLRASIVAVLDELGPAPDDVEKFGIWGGLSERERRRVRRDRHRAQQAGAA
jgi:hypothetical protein